MIKAVSYNIVNYLEQQGYLREEKEIYLYGAKLLVSYLIGTLIALAISIITNTLIEFVIYEACIYTSRGILGGYHCKSYTSCILTYVGLFLLGIGTSNIYNFDIYVFSIIQMWGIIITCICCPVQNIKKELSRSKQIYFKKYSIMYIFVYLLILNTLYYTNNEYVNMFIYIFVIINLLTMGGVVDYEKHKE